MELYTPSTERQDTVRMEFSKRSQRRSLPTRRSFPSISILFIVFSLLTGYNEGNVNAFTAMVIFFFPSCKFEFLFNCPFFILFLSSNLIFFFFFFFRTTMRTTYTLARFFQRYNDTYNYFIYVYTCVRTITKFFRQDMKQKRPFVMVRFPFKESCATISARLGNARSLTLSGI